MATETERKFLIIREEWEKLNLPKPTAIKQGYLLASPEKTIRVRLKGTKAFLTIKGKTTGFSRAEFEYPIPYEDADEMLRTIATDTVSKLRYEIEYKGKIWEADVFQDENEGLLLAEIELKSENEEFEKPVWVGQEVTSDPRYYNAYLSKHPFKTWNEKPLSSKR